MNWLTHAKTASEVRRAAISDDFARARFLNVQNFRYQLMKSGGVLDQQTLQAALSKRQPRQRRWGLSCPAILGVAFELHVSRIEDALAYLLPQPVGWCESRCVPRGALQVSCQNYKCGFADSCRQETSWSSGVKGHMIYGV